MSQYRNKVETDQCYFCPKTTDIEVHHITPQRFNGSDNRENLVALCDKCHNKLEALYDKRFYDEIGVEDVQKKRQNHFSCAVCDNRAKLKVQGAGFTGWYCRECVQRIDTYTILEEVQQ
jgi:5-methylcytosine-specific restriction endonuclease McrA